MRYESSSIAFHKTPRAVAKSTSLNFSSFFKCFARRAAIGLEFAIFLSHLSKEVYWLRWRVPEVVLVFIGKKTSELAGSSGQRIDEFAEVIAIGIPLDYLQELCHTDPQGRLNRVHVGYCYLLKPLAKLGSPGMDRILVGHLFDLYSCNYISDYWLWPLEIIDRLFQRLQGLL